MYSLTPDNAIEVLNELAPTLWRPYKGKVSNAVKLMHDNPFKQLNKILAHSDAMMWHSFHNEETWEGLEPDDMRDDDGVITTEYCNAVNLDEHVYRTVLEYYGHRFED